MTVLSRAVPKLTKLAAGGLLIAFLGLAFLAAAVVVVVLLVRFAF